MDEGFAMGYYVLEKALPLTYLCTSEEAYREYLVTDAGSPAPSAAETSELSERLGRLLSVDVMLMEGQDHSDAGLVRVWSEQPPVLDQLIETAIHPLQLICLLMPTATDSVSVLASRIGRFAPRDREVRRLTGQGIAPSFLATTFNLDETAVDLKVGKHIPTALCGRRLYAEWEHGEAVADFDRRTLELICGDDRLTLRVGRPDGLGSIPYEVQMSLFERSRAGPGGGRRRIDQLASQLRAIALWKRLLAFQGGIGPVEYDGDGDWPLALTMATTPARPRAAIHAADEEQRVQPPGV